MNENIEGSGESTSFSQGGIPNVPLKISDMFTAIKDLSRLLPQYCPIPFVTLVMVAMAVHLVPHAKEFRVSQMMGQASAAVCQSAVTYFVVTAYWQDLTGKTIDAAANVMDKIFLVFTVGFIYGLCVSAGLGFLIIPGVIIAVRASLAVTVVCLENLGIRASLAESHRLTKGHFGKIFGYLVVPFTLSLVIVIGTAMAISAMDPAFANDVVPSNGIWFTAHMPAIALSLIVTLITIVLQLTMTLMQVRLYANIKQSTVVKS